MIQGGLLETVVTVSDMKEGLFILKREETP